MRSVKFIIVPSLDNLVLLQSGALAVGTGNSFRLAGGIRTAKLAIPAALGTEVVGSCGIDGLDGIVEGVTLGVQSGNTFFMLCLELLLFVVIVKSPFYIFSNISRAQSSTASSDWRLMGYPHSGRRKLQSRPRWRIS